MTYSSGRASTVPGEASSPPDLRLLHYNDVYHLDPSSAEPVGGSARFVSLCREYREGEAFRDQPELVTLFSGDVFNPSLESSITKGPFSCIVLTHSCSCHLPKCARQPHGIHPQRD